MNSARRVVPFPLHSGDIVTPDLARDLVERGRTRPTRVHVVKGRHSGVIMVGIVTVDRPVTLKTICQIVKLVHVLCLMYDCRLH